MNDEQRVWQLEEQFWTGSVEGSSAAVHAEALMAFPAPAGILGHAAILEGLRGSARWQAVAMEDRLLSGPADDLIVLAYTARAVRAGAATYAAYCTSTWLRSGGDWKVVQHQQTPPLTM